MRLDELAKSFGDQVQFLGIYIREAHASDDQVPRNLHEGLVFDQPETADERAEVAAACMMRYNFSFPMLLDDMDNRAEEAYISWPDRLYLIDQNGNVVFKSGLGPFYFDVDELEAATRSFLAEQTT